METLVVKVLKLFQDGGNRNVAMHGQTCLHQTGTNTLEIIEVDLYYKGD